MNTQRSGHDASNMDHGMQFWLQVHLYDTPRRFGSTTVLATSVYTSVICSVGVIKYGHLFAEIMYLDWILGLVGCTM